MTKNFEFDVQDIEYLVHDGEPLLARVYTPQGEGPFPAVIELHGGAWTRFDRTRGLAVHEALARSGIVVVSLDFRQGASGGYPKSPADIHYGIRWVKAHAASLKVDPQRVGLSGNSSGAQLGMLVAMRPFDARYAAIPLPADAPEVDATVRCITMLWPVINPYGRYRFAKRLLAGETAPPEWEPERIIGLHDAYWGTEEAMAEGSPTLILERGEKVTMPPALWISAKHDEIHNYVDKESNFPGNEIERFVARYRDAGGYIEHEEFDAGKLFTVLHPTLPAAVAAMDTLVEFAHRYLD